MKRFALFLLQIKEYIILSFLVIVSLFLIFSNDNSQIRFFRAVAITTLGTFQSGLSVIPNVFEIENENKFLRESNIRLSVELAALKEIKIENQRLKKLLNFKSVFPYSLISAKIVNKSLIQSRNTLTINVGESEGVKVGMPVITDDGLVGRVISTSNGYSIVQIILNKDLKISVKNQRSRVDGILSFDGTSNLTVMNVRKNAEVGEGDIFVTSDYSSNFPSGIPVGIVSESGNLDNLFKKILLTPLVNFELLEEVFVLQILPDKEKLELEKYFNKK